MLAEDAWGGAAATFLADSKQQLAIGRRARDGNRSLLVLDEPTEGIQPSIIKDIERAIRRLAAEGEMAILLVEQYYDFARSLADRYVVLSRGEVIKAGKGADMEADGVRACLTVERRPRDRKVLHGHFPFPTEARCSRALRRPNARRARSQPRRTNQRQAKLPLV